MRPGTTLILQQSYNTDRETDRLKCKMIEISDDYIIIDIPINTRTGKTAFVSDGTYFIATFIDEYSNVYQFNTKIIKKIKRNIPGYFLYRPKEEEITRIQRRQYVRVNADVDVAVHSLDNYFPAFTTVTSDISGGGLSIIIPQDVVLSGLTECSLYFVLNNSGKYEYINVKGEITRIHRKQSEIHTASIQFLEMETESRQKVIRFCFQKQREERRKELT